MSNGNFIFQNSGNALINTGITGSQSTEAQQLALIYATERIGFRESLVKWIPGMSEMLLEFVTMGGNSGSQSARLQIEATADGSLHLVGASDGVGEYNMTFFDGPYIMTEAPNTLQRVGKAIGRYVTNDTSSVLKFYNERKNNIKGREVTIYIFNRNQGESGFWGGLERTTSDRWTTYAGIAFNGVVQKVEISLRQLEVGSYGVQVGFNLIGGWRS